MSAEFPTDAEREAIPCSRRCAERGSDLYGHTSICEEERGTTLAALAPLIRAREAAAWDAGAKAAWERSTPEVNGLHYWWRTSGEPLNPYRQEADDARD